MGILQNLQKFRVRYGSVTELTEVPRIVARAYRTHRSYKNDTYTSTPGICGTGVENLEVPGTGMNVVQNFQKSRVRV